MVLTFQTCDDGRTRREDDTTVLSPLTTVGLAALFGLAAQVLFFRHGPGLNVLVAVVLFLGLCQAVRPRDLPADRRDLWIPVSAVVFAAFCAIRAETLLLAFDVLVAVSLSIASVIVLAGVRAMNLPVAALLAESLRTMGSLLVRGAGVVAAAWPPLAALLGGRAARAGGYAAGLLLAAPFLWIFASLFGAADAVFSRTVSDLFDLRRWLDALGDAPGRLIVAAVAAWVAAGAFARLHSAPRVGETGAPARGWLAPDPAIVALVAIDLLFAVFVTLQITYLFGGRDTLEAAGLTHSAYARRGFFELIAVASLVSLVVTGAELAVRARSRPYLAAALALVALTGVILVSAAYRLDLYQRAYGWTDQRLYALAMIVFLGSALSILCLAVVRGRVRWALQPLALAALTVAAGVNAIGPADHVVRANVARVLDPSGLPEDAERRLDARYLVWLGDAALPALIELLPSLPEVDRRALGVQLRLQYERRTLPSQPWQSWNLGRERARLALEDAREHLLTYEIRPSAPVQSDRRSPGGPRGN